MSKINTVERMDLPKILFPYIPHTYIHTHKYTCIYIYIMITLPYIFKFAKKKVVDNCVANKSRISREQMLKNSKGTLADF